MNFFTPLNAIGNWFNWQWRRNNPFFTNYVFTASAPVWINVDNPMVAYMDCPHLNVVINKGAELFSNGRWELYDKSGNKIESDEILTMLNKPNPLQNGKKFLFSYYFYNRLFANAFIKKIGAGRTFPVRGLIMLPSEYIQIKLTGKFYDQLDINNIIEYYTLNNTSEGLTKTFKPDEIIYDSYNFSTTEGRGISKIRGLKMPISNIVAALKTHNVIMTDMGGKGILSNQSKDNAGGIPLGETERQRIEAQNQQRGIYGDRNGVIITNTALTFQSMSFPLSELQVDGATEEGFSEIIAAFGHDRDIYPSVKGATYENKIQGMKATYQDGIIPVADDLAITLTNELCKDGRYLKLCYDHLPIMKEDELKEAQAEMVETQRLSLLKRDGIIDAQNYADMADVDLTGTGEGQQQPITFTQNQN